MNALELVQAYVAADLNDALGANTIASAKVGRFTLNLGSRRLVAADDYRNTTNGYTGLRFDLSRKGGASSTLIYTLPQRRLPDDIPSILDNNIEFDSESSALVLWGGIVTWPKAIGSESVEASFFSLTEDDEPDLQTRNRKLNTTSLQLYRDPVPAPGITRSKPRIKWVLHERVRLAPRRTRRLRIFLSRRSWLSGRRKMAAARLCRVRRSKWR